MSGEIAPGQRVRVHVNLHLRRLSVVNPRSGRVIGYVDDITLTAVRFRYQPACVRRIREEGVRSVCAYALGIVKSVNTNPAEVSGRPVKYNPFIRPDFHYETGESVTQADRVLFIQLRAHVLA
ncbi:hypothetical protein [Amycolatopsis anabasis]|uniref:hypothetical protein n=1 Tax=Amycolatopsis anabasis TaxID=1840409 RepID=UPI00131D7DC6|nr:hypothetical protein [Amycolatopsis anabasis]